jgi:uncharacterized membrane protein
MVGRIKLAGLVAILLVIFLPSFTLAQDVNFGVSPSEVRIDDLPPGETAEFELTIHNKDDAPHVFALATCQPPEEERREGRAEFPSDSWISFSSSEIEVLANSETNVTVTVDIPQEQKWGGQNWEIWLGVAAESSDLLSAELYVRCLVSTAEGKSNIVLFAGVAVAIVLLGYGSYYYLRRKTKPE